MVSRQGEDEQECLTASWMNPCRTISYAMTGEHTVVCMIGMFYNISETLEIQNNTNNEQDKEITIVCISCLFDNSKVVLKSTLGKPCHISFVNFTMKDSTIILKNVYATFKGVTFQQVFIQDVENVSTHVYFEGSSISCFKTTPCGLSLHNSGIVKCVITHSTLNAFTIDINIKDLMLVINHTVIIQADIHVGVNSAPYLRIPSFIQFHNVTVNTNNTIINPQHSFVRGKSSAQTFSSKSEIALILTNPYLHIIGCNFHQTHVTISARRQEFEQAYFWGIIFDTKFVNSINDGDGGALTIISEVQHSRLLISSCLFKNNSALKQGSRSKGSGGGVYIKSDSLEVDFKDSLFVNNKAENTGLDI